MIQWFFSPGSSFDEHLQVVDQRPLPDDAMIYQDTYVRAVLPLRPHP